MARDAVASVVATLRSHGFDPRKVGRSSWEARCPGHKSAGRALAIRRGPGNRAVLKCRSPEDCPPARILDLLGLAHDSLVNETTEPMTTDVNATESSPHPSSAPSSNGNGAAIVAVAANGSPKSQWTQAEVPVVPAVPAPESPPVATGIPPVDSSSRVPVAFVVTAADERPSESATEVASPDTVSSVPDAEVEKQSPGGALWRMAGSARTFRASDGRYYASVPVDGHLECHELDSAGFRRWLTRVSFGATRRLPPAAALASVASALEAHAEIESDTEPVFIRMARDETGSSYVLDLGDRSRRAVEIRAEGWVVAAQPGVHFRRSAGQLALPTPARGGSIELLRKYVNVAERDFPLLIGWLTSALRPVGPYPIAVLTGEQGSAKSTLAMVCRLLIDPHDSPLRGEPKDQRDLMIAARNGWILAFDNLSALPVWLSDGLCRLSTGAGFSTRSLYSNYEEVVFRAQRPLILNGIDDYARRGDLVDRGFFLHLPPILGSRRRCEQDFWAEFHQDYPWLLGALLDAVSAGMRLWPEVQLAELPRMADAARWGEAVGRGLGWAPGTFLDAYSANRQSAGRRALEDSPAADALASFITLVGAWSGTASELLQVLRDVLRPLGARGWPKTPGALSALLRRMAPQLRMAGITVNFHHGRDARAISIKSSDWEPRDESNVDLTDL
jgi:hypothetical protein